MKPSRNTPKTWRPLALLLTVPLLSLPACAVRQPAQPILPTLPSRPSVSMPPTPSEVSTSVQNDLSELDQQRKKRVQQLMRSIQHGPSTESSRTD